MIGQDMSWKDAETKGRLVVPHLLMALFVLINVMPFPFLPTGMAKPQFILMAVYYWAIFRPTMVPPSLCFALGMLLDVFTGVVLGINALSLVLVMWIARDQRRFLMGQPYSTMWAVFGLIALLSTLLQWGFQGLISMQWAEIQPAFLGAASTMLLFPFVTYLLVAVHRMLPVASRPYP